jgi:predicted small secreted protein
MNKLILIFSLVFLSFILTGCEEQQGPAERAGKSIDKTMEDIRDAMQDAADDAEASIEDIGDELEDATD